MACQEAIRLFQRRPEVKRVKEFWYMEVPSCTEWKINNAMQTFNPNCFVEVGKEGVDAKIIITRVSTYGSLKKYLKQIDVPADVLKKWNLMSNLQSMIDNPKTRVKTSIPRKILCGNI